MNDTYAYDGLGRRVNTKLRKEGMLVQRFGPELDARQKLILDLLEIPTAAFSRL